MANPAVIAFMMFGLRRHKHTMGKPTGWPVATPTQPQPMGIEKGRRDWNRDVNASSQLPLRLVAKINVHGKSNLAGSPAPEKKQMCVAGPASLLKETIDAGEATRAGKLEQFATTTSAPPRNHVGPPCHESSA